MFKLCFNSTTLRNMDLFQALGEIKAAGYEGVELSLNSTHIHPLEACDARVRQVHAFCEENDITVACVACGGDRLLSDVPYEPSLICGDAAGRRRRIDLIKRSMEIANVLGSPVLNFNSGMLPAEVGREQAGAWLGKAVQELLGDGSELILVLEPEPGFFVGTTDAAIAVIEQVDSPRLRLNLDIGHVFCSEPRPYRAIDLALPYTRHIHIEDIKGGVHHHEIPGEGDIFFDQVIASLGTADYRYFVSVELHHHDAEWERALYESRAYLCDQILAAR